MSATTQRPPAVVEPPLEPVQVTRQGDVRYACPADDCDSTPFETERGFRIHSAKVHDGNTATLVCPECGDHFTAHASRVSEARYCSRDCLAEARRTRVTLTCAVCDKAFDVIESEADGRKYCSVECTAIGKTTQATLHCAYCGNAFDVKQSRTATRRFCSQDCVDAARTRGRDTLTCEWCSSEFTVQQRHADWRRYCSPTCPQRDAGETDTDWVETSVGLVTAQSPTTTCVVCDAHISVEPAEPGATELPPGLPPRPAREHCSKECVRSAHAQQYDRVAHKEFLEVAYCGRKWSVNRLARVLEPDGATIRRWLDDWGWLEDAGSITGRSGSVAKRESPRGRIAAAINDLYQEGRTILAARDIAAEIDGLTQYHVAQYLRGVDTRNEFWQDMVDRYGINIDPYNPPNERKTYYLRAKSPTEPPLVADGGENVDEQGDAVTAPILEELAAVERCGFSRYDAFRDWVSLMLHTATRNDDAYLDVMERYEDANERLPEGDRPADHFSRAFAELDMAVTDTQRDVLGDVYEAYSISSDRLGQHFTPHDVAALIAGLTVNTTPPDGEEHVTVADPAGCGSGRFLIAGARQADAPAVCYGVDKDPVVARMAALNCSFFNLEAAIVHGDALTFDGQQAWRIHATTEDAGVIEPVDPTDVGFERPPEDGDDDQPATDPEPTETTMNSNESTSTAAPEEVTLTGGDWA